MWPWSPAPPSAGPAAALRGTPVVPGLAHGPVVLVSQEVSPAGDRGLRRRRSRRRGCRDGARTTLRPRRWPAASPSEAARASGAASEVLTASAGLARDPGLRQARGHARLRCRTARPPSTTGSRQFVDVFTAHGRADGRAGHRPARHRTPDRRPPGGRARAGRRPARRPVGPGGRRPRAGRHRRAGPRPGPRAGHRARRRHQPHGDHRPPARHPLRGRAWPAPSSSRPAPSVLVDGDRGDGRRRRPGGRRAAPGRGRPRRASRPRDLDRACGDHRRGARRAAGQRRRRASRPGRGRPHRSRGSGSSAPSCASSTAATSPASTSRPRSTPRCWRRSPARVATSSSAPSTRARTSRSPSPPSRTRRTPRSASAASGWRRTTRACSSASSTGSPRPPRAAEPTPWVMAPMVATVAEAADFADAGPRARAEGRSHDRGAECRAAGRPDAGGRRLPVHRHQRPDAVRHGGRPARLRPGSPHRPVAAGGPADGRAHRRGGPARRQAGGRLRRGGGRPAAGRRARRHGCHVAVHGARPPYAPSARSCRRSARPPATRPHAPPWPPPTRRPAATPSAPWWPVESGVVVPRIGGCGASNRGLWWPLRHEGGLDPPQGRFDPPQGPIRPTKGRFDPPAGRFDGSTAPR